MTNENDEPSISLQTIVMAIQAIEKELVEMDERYKQSTVTPKDNLWTENDDIWRYDLDRAAQNLEEVYTHTIEAQKIINFPKYEQLVNRKSSLKSSF
jgi:hypothetical protein